MIKDPDKAKAYKHQWYLDNRERLKPRKRAWATANREKNNQWSRDWRSKNPERSRALKAKWRNKCRRSYRASALKYYYKNRPEIRRKQMAYERRRYRTDATYRLIFSLRTRIRQVLKGRVKSATSMKLLGCSPEDFWIYLESKFETGMTRENYGSIWHVDHIMPCAIFDFSRSEHQRRCFHFSNLQPMFGRDNIRKGAKVLTNQFQLL